MIKYLALPLILAEVYGYPITEALRVAITTLSQFNDDDIYITLILYDMNTYVLARKLMDQVVN